MSKLEKMINSKNNAYVLSNIKLKKTNLNSKSTSNKNKMNQKIIFPSKTKSNSNKNKLSKIIIDFFLKINEMDNSIEKIRSKLYSIPTFSSKKLFSFLDKNSKGFITLDDFKFFLRDNKISFSEKNLRKLIHNFDKKNDFSINYEEFLGIISPKKIDIIPDSKEVQEEITTEIQKIFGELICQELKFIEKCFELSEKTHKFVEFSTYEAFKEVVGTEKYLTIENLKKFFTKKAVKFEENEINQLMLRFDKDNDGVISYEEFKDIFSPLNNNEIINNTNRDYNKDFFYQYNIDDENNDIKLNEENSNNKVINNDNVENNNKNNLPLKIENKFHYKENNENDKNKININKAEERYSYNFETDLDNINNKKKQTNNRNFLSNTEIDNSMSNSIYLYKENMKNTKTEIDNNKKEYNRNLFRSKFKSVDNFNYYTHSHSNYNLLEQTKAVLGINHNSILSKIKINPEPINISKNNKNKNAKRKIIEIEYENDYKMETPNRKFKNNSKYNKDKLNKTNSDNISDSVLNYDYSRYTNKDRNKGSYYFKQKNKGEILESNNSTNNISKISDDDGNNKTNNTSNNKDKDLIWRNKNKNRNSNKRKSFSLEYNYENLFSFKDEFNTNNKDKNNDLNKTKNNYDYQNQTFDESKFKQKNNLNFNYNKNNSIDNLDFNSLNNNNAKNANIDNKNEQKYLDSLENINQENFENSPLLFTNKNKNNQYHYNIKLTRNLARNNIHSQIQNKNKANDNYSSINRKNINNFDNINQKIQNRSYLIPSYKDKNDLFNIEVENVSPNNYDKEYNKNNKILLGNNCVSNRCPKCNCFQSEDDDLEEKEDNNIDIVNTNNFKKIDNYENPQNKYNSSSLPKDYYSKKNNNFLNLDYSTDNANQNLSHNSNIIYNRNNARNKMSFYYTNNNFRNLYRNSFKLKNNFNTNNSYYYLESSYNNNNFKINQINKNIPKSNTNKNNINQNLNKIPLSNKFEALNNLFLDFIKQDNNIEKMRQLLSNREDINLMDLFSLFDNSKKRLISSSNFIQTLKKLDLIINIEDIIFLFRKFNKKENDCFDFDEFCEIILPKKHSNEKIMGVETKKKFIGKGKRENSNNNFFDKISMETKKMLALLFKNVIEGEKSNENYRKILAENEEISGFDLFNKIKKNYSVGIYKEDIANFMKKNKYKLSNNEIELLMDRFDKNKNGMIEYKEFIIEISPISKQ